jgi:hypothetical protein
VCCFALMDHGWFSNPIWIDCQAKDAELSATEQKWIYLSEQKWTVVPDL